jgi:hypothetical protein
MFFKYSNVYFLFKDNDYLNFINGITKYEYMGKEANCNKEKIIIRNEKSEKFKSDMMCFIQCKWKISEIDFLVGFINKNKNKDKLDKLGNRISKKF